MAIEWLRDRHSLQYDRTLNKVSDKTTFSGKQITKNVLDFMVSERNVKRPTFWKEIKVTF